MKKNLCLILALLMCIAMMTGCGSGNANSSNTPGGSETAPAETPAASIEPSDSVPAPAGEGVKITDNYTFEDPADLDFDTRYVLYMGPTSELVAASAEKGQLCQYMFIYAKEDKAMGEYALYVCDTAEHAEAISEEMLGYGMNASLVAEDNAVICVFTDEYALEPSIDIYQMAEMISEATASAYAQMYVDTYGAEMME